MSIERHIDAKTPPVFAWHTVPDETVPYENTLMLIDACKKAGVSIEAHLFPQGGHGLSLGTAETAWQGVNGIEPSIPDLAAAGCLLDAQNVRTIISAADAVTSNPI